MFKASGTFSKQEKLEFAKYHSEAGSGGTIFRLKEVLLVPYTPNGAAFLTILRASMRRSFAYHRTKPNG